MAFGWVCGIVLLVFGDLRLLCFGVLFRFDFVFCFGLLCLRFPLERGGFLLVEWVCFVWLILGWVGLVVA